MASSSWFRVRFTLFKFFSAAASNSVVVCFCWLTCSLLTLGAIAVSGVPSVGFGGGWEAAIVALPVVFVEAAFSALAGGCGGFLRRRGGAFGFSGSGVT